MVFGVRAEGSTLTKPMKRVVKEPTQLTLKVFAKDRRDEEALGTMREML